MSDLPWEEESTSRTRRVDEKERSQNAGGNSKKRTYMQWAKRRRRGEDKGVKRDSAVISEREKACGCDVRRPC